MFDQPVQFQEVGDAEMAFRRVGAGPTLVFVHGWPLSSATWVKVAPLLAPYCTCVLIDQAGAGATRTRAGTDFNFRGQARRLNAFLQAQGIEHAHILAQDTGATVARCAALTGGERIASLVLINTEIPGHRPPFIELFQKMMRLPGSGVLFRLLLRSPTFVASSMGFGGCFTDRSRLDADFYARTIQPLIDSPQRMAGIVSYLLGIDWGIVDGLAEGHGRIQGPVLLVWGEDDPTFPIARARAMVAQFADCRGLRPVPNASLLAHEEQPALVAEHVLAFLREIGALGGST